MSLAGFLSGPPLLAQSEPSGPASLPGGTPDATITIRAQLAGAGLGFVWGAGSLEFEGRRYPVRADGLVVGIAGGASVVAHGDVYNLRRPEDLNGEFSALGEGAAFGVGRAALRMRNKNGVVVVFTAETKGAALSAGARAITLQVGAAGGTAFSRSAGLPKTLGFGEARFGRVALRPTLNVQVAGFAEGNSGFNGTWAAGPIEDSSVFFETSNEVGANARVGLDQWGAIIGRVSGVFSLTGGGIDAAASSSHDNAYDIEDAYVAWHSEHAFPSLGFNALELGYGNQNYQVFDGLLFWNGATNGGPRGATWLAPRKAFREAAVARLTLGNFFAEGFHLKYNDDPSSGTRVGGGRLEHTFSADWVKWMKNGLLYANVYESDDPTRDGLNVINWYGAGTPLRALPDLSYTAAFAAELNSQAVDLSSAFGWYVWPAYTFSTLPWRPVLSYRYAQFQGGKTDNFDPLFVGESDWGTWFQGELLGEWVLPNSNVESHMVRLKLAPNDTFALNLFYYKFLLYRSYQAFGPTAGPVSSRGLADEFDAILDVTLTNWWSITVEFTLAVPDTAFREATGGNATWINSGLYMNWNF